MGEPFARYSFGQLFIRCLSSVTQKNSMKVSIEVVCVLMEVKGRLGLFALTVGGIHPVISGLAGFPRGKSW
jgi:hypothetical protein